MGKHLFPQRGLRIDDELYLKLRKLAADENRSFNNYVYTLLQRFVADYETANGVIDVDTDVLYE
jgi:hypothetical protein